MKHRFFELKDGTLVNLNYIVAIEPISGGAWYLHTVSSTYGKEGWSVSFRCTDAERYALLAQISEHDED